MPTRPAGRVLDRVDPQPMSGATYKGFSKEEMEFHFNPQVAAPDQSRWSEERRKASLRVRAALKSRLNIPYGNSPRQVLDIFPAAQPNGPVIAYFHGGYWRGGSKDENCRFLTLLWSSPSAEPSQAAGNRCPKISSDCAKSAASAANISRFRARATFPSQRIWLTPAALWRTLCSNRWP